MNLKLPFEVPLVKDEYWCLHSFLLISEKNDFLLWGVICYHLSLQSFIIVGFNFISHLEPKISRWNLLQWWKLKWFRGSSTSTRLNFKVGKIKIREKEWYGFQEGRWGWTLHASLLNWIHSQKNTKVAKNSFTNCLRNTRFEEALVIDLTLKIAILVKSSYFFLFRCLLFVSPA